MVITTTEFTTPAKELARTTNVELWGWEKLYENIKGVYFDGNDIYEYFSEHFQKAEAQKYVNGNEFEFEVEKVREKEEVCNTANREELNIATIIHLKIKNRTDSKIFFILNNVLIIDVLGNQIKAYTGFVGTFAQGDIYPFTGIPIIPCFYEWQVPNAKSIKKIVVLYYAGSDGILKEKIIDMPNDVHIEKPPTPIITNATVSNPQSGVSSNCFVVTLCFGRQSNEYKQMTLFRDEVLNKYLSGRFFIRQYYAYSPILIKIIGKSKTLVYFLKCILSILMLSPQIKKYGIKTTKTVGRVES